jgi:hypothetical protein
LVNPGVGQGAEVQLLPSFSAGLMNGFGPQVASWMSGGIAATSRLSCDKMQHTMATIFVACTLAGGFGSTAKLIRTVRAVTNGSANDYGNFTSMCIMLDGAFEVDRASPEAERLPRDRSFSRPIV